MAPNGVLRAKIKVGSIVEGKNSSRPDGEAVKTNEQIFAHGVYSEDPASENKKWATATPSLSLNMQIDNPGAFDKLEAGKEYYLDFIPVEP